MKNLVLLICFVFTASFAFAQASKTYVKTIDPQASQQIQLQFDYPYNVEEWDEDNLRLLIDVKLTNANDKILEQLMLAGRYKIEKKKVGDSFVLDIPGLEKEVTIRGQKLEEVVSLMIKVPRYTLVEAMDERGMASVNIKRGLSPELAAAGVTAKFDPTFYEFDVDMNITAMGKDNATEADMSIGAAAGLDVQLKEINAKIAELNKQKAALEAKMKAGN